MKIAVYGVLALALAFGMTMLDLLLTGEVFDPSEFTIELAEKALLFGSMVLIVLMTLDLRELRADQSALRGDVERAVAAGEAWRARSRLEIADFSAAIARQFDEWQLTSAEAEIAGLMLKGMALKQIARARRTSEATIRQQAGSIYAKSGLSGRAELAAYFLDSLSPMTRRSAAE